MMKCLRKFDVLNPGSPSLVLLYFLCKLPCIFYEMAVSLQIVLFCILKQLQTFIQSKYIWLDLNPI